MMPGKKNRFALKIALIGCTGVGKTTLSLRSQTPPPPFYGTEATIGANFEKISYKGVDISLWDTAGEEKFRTITSSYYRGVHCASLCIPYDFNNLQQVINAAIPWLNEVKEHGKNAYVGIVFTMSDVIENNPLAEQLLPHLKEQYPTLNFINQPFVTSSQNQTYPLNPLFDEAISLCFPDKPEVDSFERLTLSLKEFRGEMENYPLYRNHKFFSCRRADSQTMRNLMALEERETSSSRITGADLLDCCVNEKRDYRQVALDAYFAYKDHSVKELNQLRFPRIRFPFHSGTEFVIKAMVIEMLKNRARAAQQKSNATKPIPLEIDAGPSFTKNSH